MKTCIVCREAKPLSEFNKNSAKKAGVQDRCRPCDNERARQYYKINGTKQRRQIHTASKRRRFDNRKVIVEYLQTHPCVDCGESRPVTLDFDHVRGSKSFNISSATSNGVGLKAIMEEIDKCEVRCANCHRVATASRNPLHWSHKYPSVV